MIIKNAILCDVNGERRADVKVTDGKITDIADNLEGEEVVDAKGNYLLPAITDLNVSLEDGQLNASRLQQLSQDAIKGGVSTLVLNPDSDPAINNEIVLEFVTEQNYEGAKITSAICAVQDEATLSNIAILLKKGAVAPSLDSSVDSNLIRRVFEYMKMYGGTVFCTLRDKALDGNGVMIEGAVSTKLGLPGIPTLGEIIHVSKMIEFSRYFGVQVLFKGVCTKRSIEMIQAARQEGVKVYSEVSIHHLALDDTACDGFNTYAKIFPPLADETGKLSLQEALKNGHIDLLTSLHAPQSKVNKEVAFYDAAYGTEAIEEIYALYYTKLVKSGLVSLSKLTELVSLRPADIIKKKSGVFNVGAEADFILFDTQACTKVENEKSLYRGETLSGKVMSVFVSGKQI